MGQSALAVTTAWASWRPATCLPDDCFCEGLREGLIRQPANTWSSFLGFTFVNAALMAAQVTTPSLRRVVFAVLLAVALAVEWRSSRQGRRWLATGASLMVLAFLIWVVDRQRLACAPQSFFQGRAIWHVLGALAAVCLFKSYEKEA